MWLIKLSNVRVPRLAIVGFRYIWLLVEEQAEGNVECGDPE